jgi:hypothetical protein
VTDREIIQELARMGGRISRTQWSLERLLRDLPGGRTHDVVEQAVIATRKAATRLVDESAHLSRYPAPTEPEK